MSNPFFIVGQGRCGSSWLCSMMEKTAVVPVIKGVPAQGSKPEIHKNYWNSIRQNGYGVRTHYCYFQRLVQEIKETKSPIAKFKYVWVRRFDRWQHAVSQLFATQCVWNQVNPDPSLLRYDEELIVQNYHHLRHSDNLWQSFFTKYKIFPMLIWYEHLFEFPDEITKEVVFFLTGYRALRIEGTEHRVSRTKELIDWANGLREKYGDV